MNKLHNFVPRFLQVLKNIFLHGFFTLLPLILTTTVFIFFIRVIMSWVTPLHSYMPKIIQHIPYSEFLVGIILIFIFGLILKYLLFLPLVHLVESTIERIPLIGSIYFGIKQLVHAFTAHDSTAFNRVVIIEYPRKGLYSLGFITGKQHPHLELDTNKKYWHVYLPSVPNPTTGFFVLAPDEELIDTSLSRQDALTIIISGGVINPEKK